MENPEAALETIPLRVSKANLLKQAALVGLFVALVALGVAVISGLIRFGSAPHWRSLLASAVSSFVLTFALTFALNYGSWRSQAVHRRRSTVTK